MIPHSINIKEMFPYAVSFLTAQNKILEYNPVSDIYIVTDKKTLKKNIRTFEEMEMLNNKVKPR